MKRVVGGGLALLASAALATAVFAQANSDSKETKSLVLPDLTPGEGWHEQEIRPAKGIQARAWSDPAAGCQLALFYLPVSDSVGPEPMRSSLQATMAKANLTVTDEPGDVLRITGAGITGLASLRLIELPTRSASLLACYWNEREPARCQSICQGVLQDQTKATP